MSITFHLMLNHRSSCDVQIHFRHKFKPRLKEMVMENGFISFPNMPYLADQFNTLRPRQNGRHFADDMFKCISFNENVWIPIEISLKFVPKGSINNNPAMFQIMAWGRPGDKPLSEPMMVSSLKHLCVTRPQWVNRSQKQTIFKVPYLP